MSYDSKKAQQIWRTVCTIPVGKVASYGQVADLAGLPKCARLVGRVLPYAPADMSVPWHRVVKFDGKIAFKQSPDEQKGLLQEEGVLVNNNRVNMNEYGWKPDLGELMMMEF
ncbi:MAG: methylated-DNA--[protein]-cysteine S-methyltransferase [Gammaproteobacteria bacterium]|nr:methylated-DNA--[protein]-cysteine S-methyltransferase [Gammaproteobacteria bacterium]